MRSLTYLIVLTATLLTSCMPKTTTVIQYHQDADIKVSIDQMEVDKLQNLIVLTTDDRILRYDESLKLLYEYGNALSGNIVQIDPTNPQKILAFVKDFNRIIVLDNTLSEINTIDLANTRYLDIETVARSNDNRIWLFDPINQTLVKIDALAQPIFESNRLSDYNIGNISPTIIQERNNRVAMVDPELGILIFDNFGQFLKLIPELDVDHIQIFGDYIFFAQQGKFYQYHIQRYEKSQLTLDNEGYSKFKFTNESTYLYGQMGLKRLKK